MKTPRISTYTLFILISALFFISFNTYAEPVSSSSSALVEIDPTLQQQLDEDSLKLVAIDNKLSQTNLNESNLIAFQDTIENIMTNTQAVQQTAQKNVNQQTALMNALGPAPVSGATPEDSATMAKRQQLAAILSIYNDQISQANAIITHAQTEFKTITQHRLKNKAKDLMQRSLPLYRVDIWQHSVENTTTGIKQARQRAGVMLSHSTQALQQPSIALWTAATLAIAILFGTAIAWALYHYYGRRSKLAQPSLFQKITTTIANTFAKGIIPAATLFFIVFELSALMAFPTLQRETLLNIVIILGGIRIARVLIQNTLAPSMSNWRLLNVQDESARLLARQLLLFTILASLNWFVSTIDERLPVMFLLPCEFILRVSACIAGLFMLRRRYWLPTTTETSAMKDAPTTTRSTQRIFIHYLRIAAIVVFVTNPILMLLGYITLANTLFISFLQTAVIVTLLLGLHMVAYIMLGKYLGIGNTNIIDETLNLGRRSKELLHYWLVVSLDILLIVGGTIAILLAWGLDKQDLIRFVKPLFLGFSIGQYRFSLVSVLFAMLAFLGLMTLTRLTQGLLTKRVFPYTNIDSGAQHALQQGVGYIGLTIAFVISIGMLGINLASLALIAGALSVGIGFGLQHIVSNFIAGIILLVERPIKIGDRIIVGTDEGTVRRISVRATEIEAADGSSVLIPNSQLISERVRNWTFRNPLTRIEILVSVAYGSDTHQVEQLLLEIAQQHSDVTRHPEPQVIFSNFGASSLDFKLLVGVYDVNKRSSTSSELHYAIERVFRENSIDMPFPQYEVTLKQASP